MATTKEFNERVMKDIAEEAERRKCAEVASDVSKWIDTLFEEVDVESLVAEVLGELE